MAAASSNKSCLYCQDSSSDCYANGWKLRNGHYAQLCNRCLTIFNMGKFCEAFHWQECGWRYRPSCGKLVHCGCVMSLGEYSLLDFNGIICVDCSRTKCNSTESAQIPLFEKIVTASDSYSDSDSDSSLGRIVIPKKHAENVRVRGLKDLKNLTKMQPGDTVMFDARESERKIVMKVRTSH